jgi:undecaprenyl-diphosphatase
MGSNAITVAIALVVYGIAFIVIERIKGGEDVPQVIGKHSAGLVANDDTPERLSILKALGIGLFQCLAIVPGTSRSGSTILGGRILGVSRTTAAEFSFFLAIPVMFGWSALKLVKGFVLDHLSLTTTEWAVFAIGLVVAFGVSVAAIRFLMGFIKDHSFAAFGVYRIILGIAVIAFFALSGQLFS